jgi:hypothetical protein
LFTKGHQRNHSDIRQAWVAFLARREAGEPETRELAEVAVVLPCWREALFGCKELLAQWERRKPRLPRHQSEPDSAPTLRRDPTLAPDEFAVDCVLAERVIGGRRSFLIHGDGPEGESDDWVAESDCNCAELIAEFRERQRAIPAPPRLEELMPAVGDPPPDDEVQVDSISGPIGKGYHARMTDGTFRILSREFC